MLVIVPSTYALGGFRVPVENGVYTGEIVDVQTQRGWIFETDSMVTKTNERSSDTREWCVLEIRPELLEKAQRFAERDVQVRVEYHQDWFVWIDRCGYNKPIVDEISVTGGGW